MLAILIPQYNIPFVPMSKSAVMGPIAVTIEEMFYFIYYIG